MLNSIDTVAIQDNIGQSIDSALHTRDTAIMLA